MKYKLEPEPSRSPAAAAPARRSRPISAGTSLNACASGEVTFSVLRAVSATHPTADMPLDRATVRWPATASPPVHLADLDPAPAGYHRAGPSELRRKPRVEYLARHRGARPQGSIAGRAAWSTRLRRNPPRLQRRPPGARRPETRARPVSAGVDTVVVTRAAIHPAIGMARVGNSLDRLLRWPGGDRPGREPPGFYRDAAGALKRQAARFRIYGTTPAGEVVAELDRRHGRHPLDRPRRQSQGGSGTSCRWRWTSLRRRRRLCPAQPGGARASRARRSRSIPARGASAERSISGGAGPRSTPASSRTLPCHARRDPHR